MRCVRVTSAALIAAAVFTLSACSSSAADPTTDVPSAPAEDIPAQTSDARSTAAADTGNGDNFVPIVIEQVAKTLTPTPTYVITGANSVEFTFPAGSHSDDRAVSHCQIGASAIGREYDVTMTYPDGSLQCADVFN